MPVDRSQWKPWFRTLPAWECPTCAKGHLKEVKDTRHNQETGPSKRERHHDDWEPDWIQGRLVSLLECDFENCKEVASVSGNYTVDVDITFDYNNEPDQSFEDFFEVLSISPAPLAMKMIKSAPQAVKDALSKASALIWRSEDAAANSIRQAVEHLMDAKKIKKSTIKGGKKTTLQLHARIIEFQKTDKENGDILLAVKWLGNSGSHVGGLKRDDVLDAFDMVELAIDNMYGTSKATIMKKVQAVNKKKGPSAP